MLLLCLSAKTREMPDHVVDVAVRVTSLTQVRCLIQEKQKRPGILSRVVQALLTSRIVDVET